MPKLKIGDAEFDCRESLPAWQLMRLAKAMKSDDDITRLAGMHDFVLAVLLPNQRPAFEAFMDDYLGEDELDRAIGTLMESYAERPTERPSNSQPGQTPTGGTSRVVSLSRGTVETVETSSTAGHSAAS